VAKAGAQQLAERGSFFSRLGEVNSQLFTWALAYHFSEGEVYLHLDVLTVYKSCGGEEVTVYAYQA
jgi:hypothetical protein